jgi:uncharacterized protein YndB with AHSA1/START domain
VTGHVIHLSTTIDASPETVWGVLTDLPHAADILGSVKSARLITDGEYRVGTAWREERNFFGHHGEEELHVVESEPPNRTLHETRLRHDQIRTEYSIRRTPDGNSTRLMITATMDVSDRTSREKMRWNLLGGHSFESTRRMLIRDLEDLRIEAEKREGRPQEADKGKHRAS